MDTFIAGGRPTEFLIFPHSSGIEKVVLYSSQRIKLSLNLALQFYLEVWKS